MTDQDNKLTRRAFFRRAGIVAVAGGGLGVAGYLLHSSQSLREGGEPTRQGKSFAIGPKPDHPRVVAVRGGDPVERVHAAIAALGGIEHFVARGERVLIKPNMAWDSPPELGANTHPDIVEAVARLCVEAGAGSVVVAEHPVNSPELCAERSGIGEACRRAGVSLHTPAEDEFDDTDLAGESVASWPIMRALFDADKVISLPVPKHHGSSRITCALKNWLGIAGGRRSRLHQDLHGAIVDLVAAFPPTLCIADCGTVMLQNGPTGGDASDLATNDVLVAGLDPATVDAYVLPILGTDHTEVPHVTMAMARGLGTLDLSTVAQVTL